MLVVLHIPSGHFVYREDPDFMPGYGLKNAPLWGAWDPSDLVEVEITQADWDADQEAQRLKAPPTHDDRLADLERRTTAIENRLL